MLNYKISPPLKVRDIPAVMFSTLTVFTVVDAPVPENVRR